MRSRTAMCAEMQECDKHGSRRLPGKTVQTEPEAPAHGCSGLVPDLQEGRDRGVGYNKIFGVNEMLHDEFY